MNPNLIERMVLGGLALVVILTASWPAYAQDAKTPYPSMAPLDQYLITDRNAEIALARSAAPESISREAKILILGRHGYETAVEGKNGFVCVVERAWMAPSDNPEFWNPKIRGPICFNPLAARSVLPITYKRTELVLTGQSKAQDHRGIKSRIREEKTARPGTGSDELHDVEGSVPYRCRRSQRGPSDVLRSTNRR